MEGWPQAKTAVIEAEWEVQRFAVHWAEAWARAKARAWAEVKVLLAGRASGEQGAAEATGRSTCTGKGWPCA